MQLKEIINEIEKFAPFSLQENYDNSGLIYGFPETEINAALLTLDCTEEVVDEAIKKGANLIVAHHPIVFKGIKSLTGKNYVERTLLKAIQNNVAIYAAHTNLDNVLAGVNAKICEKIGLKNLSILQPKSNLLKLVTFVPIKYLDAAKDAIFEVGAGGIGNYSECSFSTEGVGTFKAGKNTNPFVGEHGKRHNEDEQRLEVVLPSTILGDAVAALKKAHPYEVPAYDIYKVERENEDVGSGMLGELSNSAETGFFLEELKRKMEISVIRHTKIVKRSIKKVAVCGGSGSFLLQDAIRAKADIFITADFKYHEFFDAEDKIIIADIGHYESEHFTPEIFYEIIKKKFPNFATHLSKVKTNPINYL